MHNDGTLFYRWNDDSSWSCVHITGSAYHADMGTSCCCGAFRQALQTTTVAVTGMNCLKYKKYNIIM